ncbi:MAG TPA: hypothetical protein VGG33_09995, partial [Polyangia bacterium]
AVASPMGSGGMMGAGGVTGFGGSGGAVDAPTANDGGGATEVRADVNVDTSAAACRFAFCEGFETSRAGAPPDPTKWKADGSPANVDTVRPHSGANALHIPPHNGGLCMEGAASCPAARFYRLTDAFPQALRQKFYGRMWFFIEQYPTNNAYYHWMVMEAGAGTGYFTGMAVRQGGESQGGPNYMMTHLETHDHRPGVLFEWPVRDQQTTIQTKRWYCLEWYYDGPNSEAKYWLDGVEKPRLRYKGPMAGQPQFNFPAEFKSVAVGWRTFQVSNSPFEAFVDDIALDAQKVGCD